MPIVDSRGNGINGSGLSCFLGITVKGKKISGRMKHKYVLSAAYAGCNVACFSFRRKVQFVETFLIHAEMNEIDTEKI